MKNTVLVVCALAVIAGLPQIAVSQTDSGADDARHGAEHRGRHGGRRAGASPLKMIERVSRRLDLDETQRQSVDNIIEAARPEFSALRKRASDSRRAMMALEPSDPDYSAKLSNLATEIGDAAAEGVRLFGRVRAEFDAELTDEQRAELAELKEEGQARFRRWRGRRGASSDDL